MLYSYDIYTKCCLFLLWQAAGGVVIKTQSKIGGMLEGKLWEVLADAYTLSMHMSRYDNTHPEQSNLQHGPCPSYGHNLTNVHLTHYYRQPQPPCPLVWHIPLHFNRRENLIPVHSHEYSLSCLKVY